MLVSASRRHTSLSTSFITTRISLRTKSKDPILKERSSVLIPSLRVTRDPKICTYNGGGTFVCHELVQLTAVMLENITVNVLNELIFYIFYPNI